jgi:predicted SAM-dependent methyltransferase
VGVVLSSTRGEYDEQGFEIYSSPAIQFPHAACLVFHHLTMEDKQRTLEQAYRILKPSGELLIVDFGKPQNL